MPVVFSDLTGIWNMVHDDWPGTLTINPSDQRLEAIDGACVYSSYVIDGTYTGQDGVPHSIRGSFQGRDTNRRTGEPCPQSEHFVQFTIAFPGNDQPFEGYVFTWQRRTIAGYTWWQGIPFGWLANKQ